MVMERKYAARIRALFGYLERLPAMVSLEIRDDYEFMDAELIELLRDAVDQVMAERQRQ